MAHVGKSVAVAQDAKFKTRTKIGAPEFAQHTTYDIVLGFPNQESTMATLDFLCPSLFQSLGLVPTPPLLPGLQHMFGLPRGCINLAKFGVGPEPKGTPGCGLQISIISLVWSFDGIWCNLINRNISELRVAIFSAINQPN